MPSRHCRSETRDTSDAANVEESKKPRAMLGLHDSLSRYFSTTSAKRQVKIPAKFDEMLLMDYTKAVVSSPYRRRRHVRQAADSPNLGSVTSASQLRTAEDTGRSDTTVCKSEPARSTRARRSTLLGRAVSSSSIRNRPSRKRRCRARLGKVRTSSTRSILSKPERAPLNEKRTREKIAVRKSSRASTASRLPPETQVSPMVATENERELATVKDSLKLRVGPKSGRKRRACTSKPHEDSAIIRSEGRHRKHVRRRPAGRDTEAESEDAQSPLLVSRSRAHCSKRAKTHRRRYSRLRSSTIGKKKVAQKNESLVDGASTALYRQVANLKVRPDDVELFNESVALASTDCNQLNAANLEQVGLPYVVIGGVQIQAWCRAPYPAEYAAQDKLYICEFCLAYLKSKRTLLRHVYKCNIYGPPGKRIYRNDYLSVFEVNGGEHTVYCQNLCLLAKLFLDHKTLHSDVEPFLFYVLTRQDDKGYHLIGYFSKEKVCVRNYNLSCIMVLPNYQKMGYGSFLIDFSYLLSRRQMRVGTPERPLSELGRISYQSYWKKIALRELAAAGNEFNFAQVGKSTGVLPSDLFEALKNAGVVVLRNDSFILVRDANKLKPSNIQFNCQLEMPSQTEHLLNWTCDRPADGNSSDDPDAKDNGGAKNEAGAEQPLETGSRVKILRSDRIRRKYARVLLLRALKKRRVLLSPDGAAKLIRMVCGRVGLNVFFTLRDGAISLKQMANTFVPGNGGDASDAKLIEQPATVAKCEQPSVVPALSDAEERPTTQRDPQSLSSDAVECSCLDDSGSRISQPQQSSSLNTVSSSTLSSFATSPPFVYSPPSQDTAAAHQYNVCTQMNSGVANEITASPLSAPVVTGKPQSPSTAQKASKFLAAENERQPECKEQPNHQMKSPSWEHLKAEPATFQRQRCLSGQPSVPSTRHLLLDRRSTMPLCQRPLFDDSTGNEMGLHRRPGTAPPIGYLCQASCLCGDQISRDLAGGSIVQNQNICYAACPTSLMRMWPQNPRFRLCCPSHRQMSPFSPRQSPLLNAHFPTMAVPVANMSQQFVDNGFPPVPSTQTAVPLGATGHELRLDHALSTSGPYAQTLEPYHGLPSQQYAPIASFESIPMQLLEKPVNSGELRWPTSPQQQAERWPDAVIGGAHIHNYMPTNGLNDSDDDGACQRAGARLCGYGCLTPSLYSSVSDSLRVSKGFPSFKSKPQFDGCRDTSNDRQRSSSPMSYFSSHMSFASDTAIPPSLFERNDAGHVIASQYRPDSRHFLRPQNSDPSTGLHPLV